MDPNQSYICVLPSQQVISTQGLVYTYVYFKHANLQWHEFEFEILILLEVYKGLFRKKSISLSHKMYGLLTQLLVAVTVC